MDIEEITTQVAGVARYMWMRDTTILKPYYTYGEHEYVDEFLAKMEPFVKAIAGHYLTDPHYFFIWEVNTYTDGVIIDVENIFGSREKVVIPFSLLEGGVAGLVRFRDLQELNSIGAQIETVQEHITKMEDRLSTLRVRQEVMKAKLWPNPDDAQKSV